MSGSFGLHFHAFLQIARLFVMQVGGAGLTFLFSALLGHWIGASGVGLYFICLTIVDVEATLARLGLENAVLRFASIAHHDNDRGSMAALYRKSLGLGCGAALVIAPFTWLIVAHLPLGGERASELHQILPLLVVAIPAVVLISLQAEFFKGLGSPTLGLFVQAVCPVSFMLPIVLVFFMSGHLQFLYVVLTYTLAMCGTAILTSVVSLYLMPGVWRKFGEFETKLLLRTGFPLLVITGMNLLIGWSDMLVLGFWAKPRDVGIYGVARGIAALTGFVLNALNSVTAPWFATLYARGDLVALASLAQRSSLWMLLTVTPAAMVFLFAPELVLRLFGPNFDEGGWVLRILTIGQLVNVATGSVGYLLMMTGFEKIMRDVIICVAIMNAIGNLSLVPIFGVTGAAASTAACVALMKLLLWFAVKRKLKINSLASFTPGVHNV